MNLSSTEAWPQAFTYRLFPHWHARRAAARIFLPPVIPRRAWELRAENNAERIQMSSGLNVLHWQAEGHAAGGRVLLVHGWGSRAAQMAGFVPQLLAQGYSVYALDAPAHGRSAGQVCEPLQYAQAVTQTIAALGGVTGLIAHASGALAASLAVRQGAQLNALVLLAAPSSLQHLLQEQMQSLTWSHDRQQRFFTALEARLGERLSYFETATGLAQKKLRLLLVHDHDDRECSAHNLDLLCQSLPQAEAWLTYGLGHRKLMRSVEVQHRVARFLAAQQAVADTPWCLAAVDMQRHQSHRGAA